jgi:flagellar capping protein FliD
MKENYIYFNSTAAATIAVGELTLTARDTSSKGNLVSIAIPESGSESTVTVSVSGNDITAAIGTSNDQHANGIATAIAANADANALVSAAGGGTTAITTAVSQTFLAGGGAFVGFPISSFAGMQPSGDSELTLYFKSMKNHDGHTDTADAEVTSDAVPLTLVTANTHRQVMKAICDQFASAKGGHGDIIISDSASDKSYISSLISAVGTIAVKDANS